MKQRLITDPRMVTYNKAVKIAYYKIFKATKQLIGTIERQDIRCTLQLTESSSYHGFKHHELVSPLVYLCLEFDGERLSIQYGFEQFSEPNHFSTLTGRFIRLLYHNTSKEQTGVDIEDCVSTNYVITACSELYEAVETGNKRHTEIVIPYKPQIAKRKQMQAVA
jgi:hypothetical protein